jgi:hypothetical protein
MDAGTSRPRPDVSHFLRMESPHLNHQANLMVAPPRWARPEIWLRPETCSAAVMICKNTHNANAPHAGHVIHAKRRKNARRALGNSSA